MCSLFIYGSVSRKISFHTISDFFVAWIRSQWAVASFKEEHKSDILSLNGEAEQTLHHTTCHVIVSWVNI